MTAKGQRILFLQLPRLDNEKSGLRENLPMAGFYLLHSLEKRGNPLPESRFLNAAEEELDDHHLTSLMLDWKPTVIAATLYLWNIERTLAVLKKVRKALPLVKIIVGGPEVAHQHPFLFKSRVPDVAVVGEGEPVFPMILNALQTGDHTNLDRVAWKTGKSYGWGKLPSPGLSLDRSLPPPGHPGWKPDSHGMAYLETGRGCPLRCIYCRYGHLRRQTTFLSAAEVKNRVRTLMDRGACEIRFVDPVFNAHPKFSAILRTLREITRTRKIAFFAEIQADLLSPDEIVLLAEAGFTEVEAGVQSLDPLVLRRVHRPVRSVPLQKNLRLLTRQGIRVTMDLMYGLPDQKRSDTEAALRWAWQFRPAHVQCLQTLLLPGTELREKRRFWKIFADHLPPYGVTSTKTLTKEDIRIIEERIHEKSPADGMTRKFVGTWLPDLFNERILVPVVSPKGLRDSPGNSSRRALVFQGVNFFSHRQTILAIIRKAILSEPHMLWQFVLNPEDEEPLDLLDEMIGEIRSHPSHWIDRFAYVAAWNRIASRRVFVLLNASRSYSPSWIESAETLLEDNFY